MLCGVGVISLFCGVLLGLFARRRRVTADGVAALGSLSQLESALQGLKGDLAHQQEETERARRRADEYFAKIEGCVREATEARQLMIRTGAEHGSAQAMMLAEIESLHMQYRALAAQYKASTGRPAARPEPRLDPAIRAVAAEFRDEHVTPYQPAPVPTPAESGLPGGG